MGRLIVHLGCRVLGSRLTSICDFASRVLGVLNERRWKEDTRFSYAPLSTLVLSSFLLFKGVFTFSTVLVCVCVLSFVRAVGLGGLQKADRDRALDPEGPWWSGEGLM